MSEIAPAAALEDMDIDGVDGLDILRVSTPVPTTPGDLPERGRAENTAPAEGDEKEREISPMRDKITVNTLLSEVQVEVGNFQSELIREIMELERLQNEYHQLDSNNKFLQKYIGELMSTSNITGGKK